MEMRCVEMLPFESRWFVLILSAIHFCTMYTSNFHKTWTLSNAFNHLKLLFECIVSISDGKQLQTNSYRSENNKFEHCYLVQKQFKLYDFNSFEFTHNIWHWFLTLISPRSFMMGPQLWKWWDCMWIESNTNRLLFKTCCTMVNNES